MVYQFLNWLTPLLGALLTPVLRKNRRTVEGLSILTVAASAISSVALLLTFPEGIYTLPVPGIRIAVSVDHLSVYMAAIASLVSLLIVIYSVEYMAGEDGYVRYYFFIQLFVGSFMALVMADNLLQTYMFWELVGLCSYSLIGFWYTRESASKAGLKAFITTRVGDFALLGGTILLFTLTDTFTFDGIGEAVAGAGVELQAPLLLGGLLIFWGAVGKSAQVPLHVWLPDAMEGPTTVSALIHAAAMVKAGVYLGARVFEIFAAFPLWGTYVAYTGVLTAFLAATMAMINDDLKRVLAYSTMSQLGLMFAGIGLLTEAGWAGGTLHIYSHAVFKALLFLAAGSVLHATATTDIAQLGGLRKKMPITYAVSVVGVLSLAGVPPLSGFFTKDIILAASFHSDFLVYLGVFATSALTVFYSFRWLAKVFHGDTKSEKADHAHESGVFMTVPMLALAGATVLGGLAVPSLEELLAVHVPATSMTEILSTVGILLLGGIPAYLLYFRKSVRPDRFTSGAIGSGIYSLLENGFYFDKAYGSLVGALLSLSRSTYKEFEKGVVDRFNMVLADVSVLLGGRIDEQVEEEVFAKGAVGVGRSSLEVGRKAVVFDFEVIDGVVNGIMDSFFATAGRLRRVQTGVIENYVFVISLATFLLITLVVFLGFYGLV